MLVGHDKVDEGDWLRDELMVAEHSLLQELTLPLREPRGLLLVLVVV